jgi:hypothetical protein
MIYTASQTWFSKFLHKLLCILWAFYRDLNNPFHFSGRWRGHLSTSRPEVSPLTSRGYVPLSHIKSLSKARYYTGDMACYPDRIPIC